ncbi:hypothetical protein AGABI1DRAFT_91206 [Agaricus bisporus var. burnettii JB137-S8]|uniref:Uncharacterized protein n=1 Tax=Agaricus bisporus var. burnettii (strain JB137-S8 / ATCC MYA-4627 / FGSC 10392) TaxID=597362 RepID=K5XX36_AGABU|nr:uncharacterized protein AGABI1DRAFT_91206 [Agaricus bisporus var. burnettii JB137-S8]EKM79845.1 hypothetical protein AGABI1DRAFT_91206 [Agaricus bisporus var. burnettii JB137-S8]
MPRHIVKHQPAENMRHSVAEARGFKIQSGDAHRYDAHPRVLEGPYGDCSASIGDNGGLFFVLNEAMACGARVSAPPSLLALSSTFVLFMGIDRHCNAGLQTYASRLVVIAQASKFTRLSKYFSHQSLDDQQTKEAVL